jgi:26S proteasome regulatory subunit N9
VNKRQLAVDVALAALVGDGVFNFGEIIEHPIMSSLTGTPEAWLADLIRVFHTGDIDRFNVLVAANRAAYDSQV